MSEKVEVSVGGSSSQSDPLRSEIMTDEIRGDLRALFDLYADEKNDVVKAKELQEMVTKYDYYPGANGFAKALNDVGIAKSDKRVTFSKFEKLMEELIIKRRAVNRIVKAFDLFDVNKNGRLTVETLTRVSAMLEEPFTKSDFEEMILAADRDGDGMVDIHDFARMMDLSDLVS